MPEMNYEKVFKVLESKVEKMKNQAKVLEVSLQELKARAQTLDKESLKSLTTQELTKLRAQLDEKISQFTGDFEKAKTYLNEEKVKIQKQVEDSFYKIKEQIQTRIEVEKNKRRARRS